jgi:hypothetical protein
MKYILQMVADESAWLNLQPEEMQPMIEAMERYNEGLRSAGAWVSGEGLDYSGNAKTVRVSDGQRAVDEGPHTPGPAQLAGFWIIETPGIEEAVDWAKQVPMTSGAIEVRPLVSDDSAD